MQTAIVYISLYNKSFLDVFLLRLGLGLGVETGRSAATRSVWSSYDEESPASSGSRVLTPPAPPGGGGGGNSKPDLDF
jgi:hypothetical protein